MKTHIYRIIIKPKSYCPEPFLTWGPINLQVVAGENYSWQRVQTYIDAFFAYAFWQLSYVRNESTGEILEESKP